MKYIFHIIFLLLFSIIQPTLLNDLQIFGVTANLFLLYVIVISCFCGKKEAAITGFVFGLFLDFFVSEVIGLNAVLMMSFGYLTSDFCERTIRKVTFGITLIIVVAVTLIYEILYYVFAFLGDLHFGNILIKIILPECLCSAIAAIPIYIVIKKFSKSLWGDKGEEIG